jgi:phosphoribosylformimino-5-aminoimidazole carboxamide ribotide isomerase
MKLIPAIDLLDGQCVRLRHGDFDQCKVYDLSTVKLAERYAAAGAEWLHVVDLAASRDGAEADSTPLYELISQCRQSVQTGGGVREAEDIQKRLDRGAGRVVVGSISATDPERFHRWLGKFGADKLVAALDVQLDNNNVPMVRTHGWTRESGQSLWRLLEFYDSADLEHVLCTDISRDGAMTGPNADLYHEINRRHPSVRVQASGGVSGLSDLRDLKDTGADSAISGKALLEGCFTVEEAIGVLQ